MIKNFFILTCQLSQNRLNQFKYMHPQWSQNYRQIDKIRMNKFVANVEKISIESGLYDQTLRNLVTFYISCTSL